jgi:HD-GYP domain-containing protein (c-di-GMP phosphodiesterase class II)
MTSKGATVEVEVGGQRGSTGAPTPVTAPAVADGVGPAGSDLQQPVRSGVLGAGPLGAHAEGERFLEDSRKRIQRRLSPREWRAELTMAIGFLIAALSIAVLFTSDRSAPLLLAGELTAVFALCARIRFEVGACHTFPTQLAFVPMLLLLPPAMVPFLVALGFSLDKGIDIVRGRAAKGRGITVLADSWFSIGPVLVMAAANVGDPSMHLWPVYLAALFAQFAGETIAGGTREWLHGGASGREQLLESAWIYLVDALLSPIGVAVALVALNDPVAVLFVVPLAGLLLIFARERADHVNSLLALREAYRGTAHVLGDVVEHDDAYTGEHTRGVTELALETAAEMGLDETVARNVEFAASLHDVGKIAIPKRIINKRGPLDEDEWAVIKTHTIEAQRMLDRIGGLMSGVGEIVRSAHERFDGKGYPDGLSGEEIPIEARIVFACDAFNAITTDRPYRRGRSPEEAIVELKSNSGTQFDPRVVDALVRCVERSLARLPSPVTTG